MAPEGQPRDRCKGTTPRAAHGGRVLQPPADVADLRQVDPGARARLRQLSDELIADALARR